MRRLARWVLTLCLVVSLLLCLATCALWVRSYWFEEVVVLPRRAGGDDYSAYSQRGEACIQWREGSGDASDEPGEFLHRAYPADPGANFRPPKSRERWPGGFLVESGTLDQPVYIGPPLAEPLPQYRYVAIVLPHWSLAAAFLISPVLALIGMIRRRRRAWHATSDGTVGVQEFIEKTREVIAKHGLDHYLPTLVLDSGRAVRIAVLHDVPPGVDVEQFAKDWASRVATGSQDFLLAFKVDAAHFKVVSRRGGVVEEQLVAAGAA